MSYLITSLVLISTAGFCSGLGIGFFKRLTSELY